MKFFSTVLFLLALVDLGTSVLMCYQCSDKNPSENGLCTTSKELSWSGCRTYFQPCVTIIDKNKKVEKGCLVEGKDEPAKLEDGCYKDSEGRLIIACSDFQCNNKNQSCKGKTIQKITKKYGVV